MRRPFFLVPLAIILICALVAQDKLPPQAQRGREVFSKTDKGAPCATCHSLAGVGTAVGPDLKVLCSAVGPHGIVMAMHMTLPAYVKDIALKDGTNFPGMEKSNQGGDMEIWDLSQNPPTVRKLTAKDVASSKSSTAWKHPPATTEYTSQELADLVGFLKWASTGSGKVIKAEDVEDAK